MRQTFLASLFSIFCFLVFVSPALAAPSINMSKTGGYLRMYFTDLKTVSKIDWTVYYDTTTTQTGFSGGKKLGRSTRTYSRTELLGTRSSKYTTFHKGVKNMTADVTFTLRSGGTVNVTKILP